MRCSECSNILIGSGSAAYCVVCKAQQRGTTNILPAINYKGSGRTPIELLQSENASLRQQLAEALEKNKAMHQQLCDLMSESRGVAGLHLNGDLAEWGWLVENEWLSLWDESPEADNA